MKNVLLILVVVLFSFCSKNINKKVSIPNTTITKKLTYKDSLSKLKAVVITSFQNYEINNIEISNNEDNEIIKNLKSIGIYKISHLRFSERYDRYSFKKAFLNEIKNADIIVITCHGGYDDGIPFFDIGGEYIYEKDLNIKKNSIIIHNRTCYSGGSSLNDTTDIGNEEAINRVKAFSSMWYNRGAGLYFSNIYFESFLKGFFKEKKDIEFYLDEYRKLEKLLNHTNKLDGGKIIDVYTNNSETIKSSIDDKKITIFKMKHDINELKIQYINGIKHESYYNRKMLYGIALVYKPNFNIYNLIK